MPCARARGSHQSPQLTSTSDLDGTLDVAGTTASDGDVKIALGDGDGTFGPAQVYEGVSFDTLAITAGDFTGDGRPDLITNNEYGGESKIIVMLKGLGDGTFAKFNYWTTGNEDPTPVELNGDSHLDLVTYSSDPGFIYSTLGGAKGKFKAPRDVAGNATGSPVPAEVNGDGFPDVVAAGVGYDGTGFSGLVTTYPSKADGTLGKPISSTVVDPTLGSFDSLGQIALADVDEDGKIDLVAGFVHFESKPGNVWVLFGNGVGRFKNLTKFDTGNLLVDNPSIAVGDVDGDTHLDIVGHTNAALSVLLGNGDGTFEPEIPSGSTGGNQPGVHLADFTNDGKPDIFNINLTDRSLYATYINKSRMP